MLAAAVVVGVLVLGAVGFLLGRELIHPAEPAVPGGGNVDISWTVVGGQTVPVSASHGPTQSNSGLAAGFSHDELGAALAAIHISFRLTSEAGPFVYESTARQQCFGDINTTINQIRGSGTSPPGSEATELHYKIMSGDPSGDLVQVSIAGKTIETATAGGYGVTERTLRWTGSDWQLQVPFSSARLVADVSGYTSFGRPTS